MEREQKESTRKGHWHLGEADRERRYLEVANGKVRKAFELTVNRLDLGSTGWGDGRSLSCVAQKQPNSRVASVRPR